MINALRALFTPRAIAGGTSPGTRLSNLPVHPNYTGNRLVKQ